MMHILITILTIIIATSIIVNNAIKETDQQVKKINTIENKLRLNNIFHFI